jgi:hypothetical protein
MRLLTAILAALALGLAARADVITLKNGQKREGRVVEESEDSVKLEIAVGTIKGVVSISKSEIASIERGMSDNEKLMADYEKRKAALNDKDAGAWQELGDWCGRQKGMSSLGREAYQRAVQIDPNQTGARLALGYENVNGVWKTHDEAMAAKGFVQFEGKWMVPSEKSKIIEERQTAKSNENAVKVMTQAQAEAAAREQQQQAAAASASAKTGVDLHPVEQPDQPMFTPFQTVIVQPSGAVMSIPQGSPVIVSPYAGMTPGYYGQSVYGTYQSPYVMPYYGGYGGGYGWRMTGGSRNFRWILSSSR